MMELFKPKPLSARQAERLIKIAAKGRRHFILYRGVLGWGITCLVLTTVWRWHDNYGWHFPPTKEVWFDLLRGLLIWPAGGYLFGAIMWKRYFPSGPKSPASFPTKS